MIDASVLVREYLLGQGSVTALLGTNANGSIYCAYDLPEHFNPALGPAIQVFRAGGHSHSEITVLTDARLQIRAWADVEEYTTSADVYSAINDALHGLCGAGLSDGTIVRALEVSGPSEMTDPETGWVATYAFYMVMVRPNTGSYVGPGQTSFAAGLTRYSNIASPPTLVQVGSTATWTLSAAFKDSAMVFRNGELLAPGAGNDYTTSGNSITFAIAPSPSDNLIVME